MQEIRDRIEKHRRRTDDLILGATVRMNSYGQAFKHDEADALRRSLELLGLANHYFWLASLALEKP